MIEIYEHTIEETLINKNGYILDIGCLGFQFTKEMKKYCNNIIGIDPNPNIKNIPNDIIFYNKALVNNNSDYINYHTYNDKSGNSLLKPDKDWCKYINTIKVKCIMKEHNIDQFELIKIDIEGGEYEFLNKIDWTISKQYTIEFHDFRNMNPYYPNNESYYDKLFSKMEKYCDIIKHKKTSHPGFPKGKGDNYWDSLFFLKKEFYK